MKLFIADIFSFQLKITVNDLRSTIDYNTALCNAKCKHYNYCKKLVIIAVSKQLRNDLLYCVSVCTHDAHGSK